MSKTIYKINQDIESHRKNIGSVKEISDGHHTFSDLYYHRMILTKIVAESYPTYAWKSWLHHDGTMFEGDFIIGFSTPDGQYSYHYKAMFWDEFNVKVLDHAPEYDGHQPNDITRLISLLKTKSN